MLYPLKQNYQKKHQLAANLDKLSLNGKALWENLIKAALQKKKYYLCLKTQKEGMNTLNAKFCNNKKPLRFVGWVPNKNIMLKDSYITYEYFLTIYL